MKTHQKVDYKPVVREMVIPFIGGGNSGSRLRGDRDISHEEAETRL